MANKYLNRMAFAVVAAMLLPGCGSVGGRLAHVEAQIDQYDPIATATEFRSVATNRPLFYPNGDVMRYGRDGTWRVERGSEIVATGTWSWQGDRWCGEGAARGGPVAPQCQTVAASPQGLRFSRPDGTSGTLAFER